METSSVRQVDRMSLTILESAKRATSMRTPNHLLMIIAGTILLAAALAPDREPAELAAPLPTLSFARGRLWLYEKSPEERDQLRVTLGDEDFADMIEGQIRDIERSGGHPGLERIRQIQREHDARTLRLASASHP